ncbi:hypothetical protein KEM56_007119 [Ascosphaera pollenicola]|nr:hypothetical protein KEM56_007119 [Ascosphaera pollenicola]
MSSGALKAEKRPLGREQAAIPESTRSKRRRIGRQPSSKAQSLSLAPPESAAVAVGEAPIVTSQSASSSRYVAKGLESISSEWSVSQVTGGRFNDCDPVLTVDRKHLILSLDNTVQVYSIATSLIVRTLHPTTTTAGVVIGHGLSSSNENHLYVSFSSGEITLWDWTNGTEITSFKQQESNVHLALSAASNSSGTVSDVVFVLGASPLGSGTVYAHVLAGDEKQAVKPILRSGKALQFLQASSDGRTVIAAGGDQLVIGYTSQNAVVDFDNLTYNWLELSLPLAVTCMDIREDQPQSETTLKRSTRSRGVDLVLGDKGGAILLYRDIVGSLLRMGKDQKAKLNPNRFHWHRFGVKAVRWSRDGNYLISGGVENVLVLWQLDSGRKQFLPHLSSHICSLAVSPNGDAYAAKLADNSAMVLSTAELRPIANVTGLQLADVWREKRPSPSALHPLNPEHLLLAVASAPTLSSISSSPNSFLQTFDIRSGRHISRQALTRTNVSVHATGPNGTELTTPNVTHLQMTSDGEWLATVDEWAQYKSDTSVCSPTILQSGERREIFLKFWRWNESSRSWDLNTRVESPHFKINVGSTLILDVSVNPDATMFATIGGDSTIRIWTPRIRPRQKQKGRDVGSHPDLVTWKCHRSISLKSHLLPTKHTRLAFSPDGSVLAVSWSDKKSKGVVHLINPHTGEICHSRYGLFAGDIKSLGFINRHLVILCERLLVWDIIADKVESAVVQSETSPGSIASPDLLAVNPTDNNFAIVFTGDNGAKSTLMILSPQSFVPLFKTALDGRCVSLLLDAKSGNYVVVDSMARVLRISSRWEKGIADESVESSLALDTSKPKHGLRQLLGQSAAMDRNSANVVESGEQEGRGATEKGLASILDVGPSFVFSGVQQLFRNVVEHFAA